jgi:hypothetical protein
MSIDRALLIKYRVVLLKYTLSAFPEGTIDLLVRNHPMVSHGFDDLDTRPTLLISHGEIHLFRARFPSSRPGKHTGHFSTL